MATDIFGDLQQSLWKEQAVVKKEEPPKMRVAIDRLEMVQLCKLASLVRQKDYKGVERLLHHGVEGLVNYVHPYDNLATVLSIATDLNDEQMVEFLINKGADPNVLDLKGRSAATRACEYGNVESLKVLIEAGADVTLTDDDGNSILFYCIGASKRHVNCARLCLETGALVNVVNKFGTPLIVAHCENASNNEDICILLMENGAHADVMDTTTRRTALMAAAANGSVKVVKAILERGCSNINEKMVNTNSHVTHDAARGGNIDIMKLLSAYGADFDQTTSHAYCRSLTPMHIAAASDKGLCCLFAGQRGTNATLKNREGLTPAVVAKKAGFKATSRMCKQTERFAPSKKKKKVRKPALWLIKLHDFLYVREEKLLEEFAQYDPDRENLVPINQFMQVVDRCKMPIPAEEKEAFMDVVAMYMEEDEMVNYVKFLIGKEYIPKKLRMTRFEKKIKKLKAIKGKAKANIPIFTLPEAHRRFEYLKLYNRTYDPFKFDRDHPPKNEIMDDSFWYMEPPEERYITVADAIMKEDEISIDRALSEGMKVDERSKFFKTPLMTAILNNNMAFVTKFVEAGANVNQRDNFLWTPLHLACHVGNLEIVQYLLKKGAKPTNVSINKALPVVRALEAKALELVKTMIGAAKNQLEEVDRKGNNLLQLAAVFADFFIFQFLESQKVPDNKKQKQRKSTKKKKGNTYTFPSMTFVEKIPPLIPPPPPTTIATVPSVYHSRMIETTTSQTYNENLSEKLVFRPRALWMMQKTSEELIEEKILKRKILGWTIDSDMYKPKVVENVEDKAQKLQEEMDQKVIRPILKMKPTKKPKVVVSEAVLRSSESRKTLAAQRKTHVFKAFGNNDLPKEESILPDISTPDPEKNTHRITDSLMKATKEQGDNMLKRSIAITNTESLIRKSMMYASKARPSKFKGKSVEAFDNTKKESN